MNKALSVSRSEVGKHTPKMEKINVDKKNIATVIGSGATIREIVEKSGAKVDVNDEGENSCCPRRRVEKCCYAND